ncbi:hypothetical protein Mal64_14860 [Pseudobythopirellula maris]|uniref:Uncharacterized protein n=1 Tax=Pseudobythopirellula maris TaxID=2527991 RepID=A0A5C5ZVP9_9BACT|nr:HYExAFE family protein [Pseudobythopirellula maris]TWT91087.1 hypothetical protein Mal64_14860 [Pseudobythopirellula maris]
MAKRHNHYEAAFEEYLREERIPYVAVDEKRRALRSGGSLKSLDFIVSPETPPAYEYSPMGGGERWLVDVKGRRFPSGLSSPQYWRNWSTRDELDSLAHWAERFGPGFTAMLVFAFHLTADRSPVAPEKIFYWRGEAYAFVGVRLSDYRRAARPLSARWRTVTTGVKQFRRIARPVDELFAEPAPMGAHS